MPRFKQIQSRFTQGELDPKMLGRIDIDQYYGAAEELTNVFPMPQGGIKRRPGLEYLDRVLGQITKISAGSITASTPNGGGSVTLIAAGTGSIIGDMTDVVASPGGEALAFDGTTSANNNNSAQKNTSTFCYIGKDYSADPKQIGQGKVWGSSNLGFLGAGSGTVSATMYGKNGSAPSNSTDGTSIGAGSVTDSGGATITITSTDTSTAYDYVWIRLSASSDVFYVAECQFSEPTVANLTDQDRSTTVTTTTSISTTNPYVVAHYDLGSAQDIGVIYVSDLALTVSGTSDEFYIQVSTDNSAWTSLGTALEISTTAKDFSRRAHGSYQYVRLARVGSTDLSTNKVTVSGMDVATESGLSNTRCIDFEFNISQTYKMVLSDKNLAIYLDDDYLIDIYLSNFTNSRLSEVWWEFEADTLLLFHEDVQTQKLLRNGSDDVWDLSTITYSYVPPYAFSGTSTSEPAFALSITGGGYTGVGAILTLGSSASFTSAYEGQYINLIGNRRGRFYIIEYVDSSTLKGQVVVAPDSTSSAGSGTWELESGYEDLWSGSRGWPRRGVFYQGRLWVDGGKGRPSVLYGSVVDDFFNFDFGDFTDDKAIGPLTGGFDPIEALYAGRNLMAFTSRAEYIVPQTFGEPVTPSNAALNKQSSVGSEAGFRPQEFEGGVMYIQREGGSIQEFLFTDTQQAYANNFISLLSSHLISGPLDFVLRRGTSAQEGAYLLMPKSDGNLTMANILQSQGIVSFFEVETDGEFQSCGADNTDMYFVITRNINGTDYNYLERFNDNHKLDASLRFTTGLPTDTFTVAHLDGETVYALRDGNIESGLSVSSESVTLSANATTSAEIGYTFTYTAKDLPVEQPQLGTILGNPVNISEIILRLSGTGTITVNGKDITLSNFTGVKRLYGWKGWGQGQVTITQTNPYDFTLLNLAKRVNV